MPAKVETDVSGEGFGVVLGRPLAGKLAPVPMLRRERREGLRERLVGVSMPLAMRSMLVVCLLWLLLALCADYEGRVVIL